ncbi:MAG TPA: hypothetical protein VNI84_21770 [Pyrinomonadaceae bacterium]|nr:hypothetical protein [Pyrinomonadaceae bacterium]
MKDMLYALLALIAAALAAYFFYSFQKYDDGSNSLIIGIIFALVAVVFGGLFMFGKVNRHEEIHITE